VPTLDGSVNLKVATGTNTGDKATLSGMGMKRLGSRRGGAGDLKVEFRVDFPKYLSANQRTLMEMLADEMGDKTAKRIMNVSSSSSSSAPPDGSDPESHKNEGFLKSMWHTFTNHPAHQKGPEASTDSSDETKTKEPKKPTDQEPKKDAGSGSG
jgi:molecular chaperone DnaJ